MLGCVLNIKNKRSDRWTRKRRQTFNRCVSLDCIATNSLTVILSSFFVPLVLGNLGDEGLRLHWEGNESFHQTLTRAECSFSFTTRESPLKLSKSFCKSLKQTLKSLCNLFGGSSKPLQILLHFRTIPWELLQTLNQLDKRSKFLKKLVLLQWESITV